MKTVKEVYDFFQQGVSTAGKDLGKLVSSDPDFTIKKAGDGFGGGTGERVPVSQKN